MPQSCSVFCKFQTSGESFQLEFLHHPTAADVAERVADEAGFLIPEGFMPVLFSADPRGAERPWVRLLAEHQMKDQQEVKIELRSINIGTPTPNLEYPVPSASA